MTNNPVSFFNHRRYIGFKQTLGKVGKFTFLNNNSYNYNKTLWIQK